MTNGSISIGVMMMKIKVFTIGIIALLPAMSIGINNADTRKSSKISSLCTWELEGHRVTIQANDAKNIKLHSRWHGKSKEGCK